MAQIYGAGQQDTDNQNAEALQAALAQRQVTLQGQPQGGSDVPSHENSDPVSDESEILRSRQPLTEKRRVPCVPCRSCGDVRETPDRAAGSGLGLHRCLTRVNGLPPAETDMQRHFRVSPPCVPQMVLTLERARAYPPPAGSG